MKHFRDTAVNVPEHLDRFHGPEDLMRLLHCQLSMLFFFQSNEYGVEAEFFERLLAPPSVRIKRLAAESNL